MQVDMLFPEAKVYSVDRADVLLGDKFSLIAHADSPVSWYADNDPVLVVKGSGNVADIEAAALGQSNILVVSEVRRDLMVLKKIVIRVVQTLNGNVADLGLSADPPVLK